MPQQTQEATTMAGIRFFKVRYVDIPEHPEVHHYIRTVKRTIYINRCACAGANVVQLIQ
jgi:hypothetical protein